MIKSGPRTKHNIDIVFIMVLFLIFTFSALSILMLAINCYRGVVLASEENANQRICTAYIKEKIHQYDMNGNINVEIVDGTNTIKISDDEENYTYIYFYDGALRELSVKEISDASLEMGQKIVELSDMSIEQVNPSIVKIVITDKYGSEEIVKVSLKTKEAMK